MDKVHITTQGETWDEISLRRHGTEKNASLITRANPAHIDVIFFAGGVSLRIPERVDAAKADFPAPPWMRPANEV